MRVHPSNYAITGFTASVATGDLAAIAHEANLPLIEDLGSGTLIDLERWGLPHEPTPRDTIRAGADLVTFSGDKLLGGPQAGIIAGRKAAIDRLKKHPLARVLRLDKMTLAALEATLRIYLDPERALRDIPTLHMLTRPAAEVAERARLLVERITETAGDAYVAAAMPDVSRAGGGALPLADIPTTVVTLSPRAMGANELEAALRLGEPTIVARIKDGRVVIDPRTLDEREETLVVERLARIAAGE